MNERSSDLDLVVASQAGSLEAERELVIRYTPLVAMVVRRENLFASGQTEQDLTQSGYIGLLKAIRSYNSQGGASLKTYATTCIRNEIISTVRTALTHRHEPLSGFLSLDDHLELQHEELVDTVTPSPEEQLLADEFSDRLDEFITHRLSTYERDILTRYASGYTYEEIGNQLGVSAKSIDNGLQRMRSKMRRYLQD